MDKDQTIDYIVQKIKTIPQLYLLEPVHFWDGDLCAVGLKRDTQLVYISTFDYIREDVVRYDFEFEILDDTDYSKYVITKKREGVTEDELICEMKLFFGEQSQV